MALLSHATAAHSKGNRLSGRLIEQLIAPRSARGDDVSVDTAGYVSSELKTRAFTVYYGGAWWGRVCVAFTLLTLCALLAGLTLGVCGLDMAWLQMTSITGTAQERKQATVVARMKRRATWMLCSLVICSVACSEYFPFIIQSLCQTDQEWVAVVISTLLLAVFAELIPQWLIPQRAIIWGYYCWPIIWGSMWLTGIVSYPVAWLLDSLGNRQSSHSAVFTPEQLAVIIKFHERSEKRGGQLGQDTVRIMLGALKNEGKKIGGDIPRFPDSSREGSSQDLEKADLVVTQGMIVKWSAVKTVDIDEAVDDAFIKKIKSWSYSRFPVIGDARGSVGGNRTTHHWGGKKIFGFFHIKNLIGLQEKAKAGCLKGPTVRDLHLYPMPIIREDMSVFELLNMFQLGMSRMAVVVPSNLPSHYTDRSAKTSTPLWTATRRTNARIMSRMKETKGQMGWNADYLGAAQTTADNNSVGVRGVFGISSPKPIGIVTFEDIIDTILQKTSRDERDFFDRELKTPPTKARRPGDYQPTSSVRSAARVDNDASILLYKPPKSRGSSLRKRKSSRLEKPMAGDGVDEYSQEWSDEILSVVSKTRKDYGDSSYTQNSQGGFHGIDASNSNNCTATNSTSVDILELPGKFSSAFRGGHYSLPCRSNSTLKHVGLLKMWRNVSAAPRTPQLRRVTPFPQRKNPSDEKKLENLPKDEAMLVMPNASTERGSAPLSRITPGDGISKQTHVQDISGDTISLSSWYGDAINSGGHTPEILDIESVFNAEEVDKSRVCFTTCTPKTGDTEDVNVRAREYVGFPPELLEQNKENQVPDYSSRTMPRLIGSTAEPIHEGNDSDPPHRDKSFHDDRALLPSQRRVLNESLNIGNARSSSLWF